MTDSDAAAAAAAIAKEELLDPSMNFVERAKYIHPPARHGRIESFFACWRLRCTSVSTPTRWTSSPSDRKRPASLNSSKRSAPSCAVRGGDGLSPRSRMLISDKDFASNAEFFQTAFEIGRRHKVMNPEKMRSEYGKMIYLLQDSQMEEVQELLEFKLVRPMRTAHELLREEGRARDARGRSDVPDG